MGSRRREPRGWSYFKENVENQHFYFKEIVTLLYFYFKENVKFIKHIGNYAQRMIIDTVKDDCIYEKDGMYYIDYLKFDIVFNLSLVNFYTDFVLDDVNNYDHLDSIGVFDYITDECGETHCQDLYGRFHPLPSPLCAGQGRG